MHASIGRSTREETAAVSPERRYCRVIASGPSARLAAIAAIAAVFLVTAAPVAGSPGDKLLKELKEDSGLYEDARWQKYVRDIGARLLPHTPDRDKEFHFNILDGAAINAMAMPDAHVFVSRGLLAYVKSEDELASVIGHEIAHITARHSSKKRLTNLLGKSIGFVFRDRDRARATAAAIQRGHRILDIGLRSRDGTGGGPPRRRIHSAGRLQPDGRPRHCCMCSRIRISSTVAWRDDREATTACSRPIRSRTSACTMPSPTPSSTCPRNSPNPLAISGTFMNGLVYGDEAARGTGARQHLLPQRATGGDRVPGQLEGRLLVRPGQRRRSRRCGRCQHQCHAPSAGQAPSRRNNTSSRS